MFALEVLDMIGFLIGAVCLVALVKVLRGGRGWGPGRFGHGYAGGWRRGGGGDMRSRFWLRALFERLDTSPGQEKLIGGALEELWTKRRALHEELAKSRGDVARAMRGESFVDTALADAFARQDGLLVELRESLSNVMKTVHDALDERQRKILGDILEGGGGDWRWRGGGFGGGPYRQAWA
jgi:hypothetical protein